MKQKRGQIKSLSCHLLTFSLILLSTDAFGAIINVPTLAYPTIQAGIDAANTGDLVLVANGTYTGPGNRNIDFGGKAITVKSAGGPVNCIIDVEGSESNPGRGFYFHSSEGKNSVLSGFTITGGYFDLNGVKGGGILIDSNSSPTIINCIIKQNKALGGGISSSGAPEISNCIIENNQAQGVFGGIYSNGPAIIKDCIIKDNHGHYGAGGIYASGGTTISNCIIIGNSSSSNGGGIEISGAADVVGCIIDSNFHTGDAYGGGIYMYKSTANIINCTISNNNKAYYAGGGIAMWNSSPNIIGCNIFGNYTFGEGGGIAMIGSSPFISRCNINNNTAGASLGHGGGIYIASSSPRIENCNITGNLAFFSGTAIYITYEEGENMHLLIQK